MFYQIQRKIAAKLALVIVFVVTIVSIVSTLYFNHINKKNLTEYLNISLSNAIYFAAMVYGQPLWDYNENEIKRLSQVVLKNKLIIAVNLFDIDKFLIGSVKKQSESSSKMLGYEALPAKRLPQDIFSDTVTEYKVETIRTPYAVASDDFYIKKLSGNITLKDKSVGKFEIFYTEEFIHNAIFLSNSRMILSFIIIALLIITVVMVGASKINQPILELALLSEKIAQDNDFSIEIRKIDRIDEVGTLFNGFANMVEQIRQKEIERNTLHETLQKSLEHFNFIFATLQQAIDNSDYSMRIKPETEIEEDILATSLNKVMQTLEEADITKHHQNFLKNGQTELSSIIAREQDLTQIAQKATEFIATYVNSQVGAFFVKDESENGFRMVASYAFSRNSNTLSHFRPGEGLPGQAALEKKVIVLTEVPDDYIKIESSLGNISPRNIIILPVIYEDDVKGVIELGSVRTFSHLHLEFLKIASEVLAVSINGAIFNAKIATLLDQTRKQAEAMKRQQEELRTTNEELEEQTRILKLSEEKLHAQQEELQASNEELEEKTQILKAQKREIEKSNATLKAKQIEIEEKAAQILMETQYKSEFLANMSHELRTPLNSLLILASMLAENEDANLTPDQIESASSIYRSGQNLLHIINNILDLSKIEAKKIELNISRCPIRDIASHFKSEFLHVAKEKGIEFKVIIDDNLPEMVTTDIHRVEQIIRNLVGNAVKFTAIGTIVLRFQRPASEIFIKAPPTDTGYLALSHTVSLGEKNAIAISVNDTGPGIPADKTEVIFEAFKQVDGSIRRKHDGTGLGLSISRELAHLLGGDIDVQSEIGKGSTFTLYIPEELSSDRQNLLFSSSANAGNKLIISSQLVGMQTVLSEFSPASENDFATDSNLTVIEEQRMNADLLSEPSTILSESLSESSTASGKGSNASDDAASSEGNRFSDESSKIMLIIEDDSDFARVVSNFFEKHGYATVIASTGEDGIKYLLDQKPAAIILDIALPGIDGWAVMNELKANPATKDIPVHIMSGYDQSRKGLEKGAVGYLTKPVSGDDLNRALLKIETVIANNVKNLLVVAKSCELQLGILKFMGTNDIRVTGALSGDEAISLLKEHHFDCMILEIGLPDISGFELMDRISSDPKIDILPVILFTGRDLTSEESQKLEHYASSIIFKNAVSMERLIDETALFLHRVERELPEEQKNKVKKVMDQQTTLKSKRVLVVDDDMRNAFALNKFLQSRGMYVTIANNGKKALQSLEDGEIPDIILMDIMMPVMDGYEAMRRIRNNSAFQTIPIIALTAKAMSSDRDECLRCGASDYLSKPLDTGKLMTLLKVWLYR